ncbi:MAG: hypothetical protein AB7O44_17240 [Hyphomicrobiaceae bacterium]
MIGGLLMMVAAIIMFLLALPRQGQVVGFLRNRDSTQAVYMMTIILLLALGLVITLSPTKS